MFEFGSNLLTVVGKTEIPLKLGYYSNCNIAATEGIYRTLWSQFDDVISSVCNNIIPCMPNKTTLMELPSSYPFQMQWP